jgi:hypothetical protein
MYWNNCTVVIEGCVEDMNINMYGSKRSGGTDMLMGLPKKEEMLLLSMLSFGKVN